KAQGEIKNGRSGTAAGKSNGNIGKHGCISPWAFHISKRKARFALLSDAACVSPIRHRKDPFRGSEPLVPDGEEHCQPSAKGFDHQPEPSRHYGGLRRSRGPRSRADILGRDRERQTSISSVYRGI